ncbi:MAG: hypothetical protein ACRCX4_09285 [Bacteroidales bacterium]
METVKKSSLIVRSFSAEYNKEAYSELLKCDCVLSVESTPKESDWAGDTEWTITVAADKLNDDFSEKFSEFCKGLQLVAWVD